MPFEIQYCSLISFGSDSVLSPSGERSWLWRWPVPLLLALLLHHETCCASPFGRSGFCGRVAKHLLLLQQLPAHEQLLRVHRGQLVLCGPQLEPSGVVLVSCREGPLAVQGRSCSEYPSHASLLDRPRTHRPQGAFALSKICCQFQEFEVSSAGDLSGDQCSLVCEVSTLRLYQPQAWVVLAHVLGFDPQLEGSLLVFWKQLPLNPWMSPAVASVPLTTVSFWARCVLPRLVLPFSPVSWCARKAVWAGLALAWPSRLRL